MNGKKKYQVNILSPEDIHVDTNYALTLCPDDTLQFWNVNTVQRLNMSLAYARSLLNTLGKMIHIGLYLEVSRTGRIHYHGVINFLSQDAIKEFYLIRLHKILEHFRVEIDTISDYDEWDAYCTKASHLWEISIDTNSAVEFIKKQNDCSINELGILKYFK